MISKYIGGQRSVFFDNDSVESLIESIKFMYDDLDNFLPFSKSRKLVRLLLDVMQDNIEDDFEINNDSIGHYECHGFCGFDNQDDYKAGELNLSIPIQSIELTESEKESLIELLNSTDYSYLENCFKKDIVSGSPEFDDLDVTISNHTLYLTMTYTATIEEENSDYYDY